MTYIGIRRREIRPQEPKGSRRQKKRRGASIGSWLWRFHFCCLFSSSFRQKRQRKEGGEGRGWESSRASLRPNKNKMAALIKKRTLMLVSDARPRASQAWKRRPAFFGETWSFVGPCVTLTNFPSRNVLPPPQIKAEWRVLGFWFGGAINRKAWKDWKWTQACSGRDALRLFCFLYFYFFFYCRFFRRWPRSLVIVCCSRRRAARYLNYCRLSFFICQQILRLKPTANSLVSVCILISFTHCLQWLTF